VVSEYLQCIVWFCHKARVWQTDGQTYGQNYDSQDRASIATSRGKTTQKPNRKAVHTEDVFIKSSRGVYTMEQMFDGLGLDFFSFIDTMLG